MNDNFQNKKILIISYYFPPSTQVGGKRFAFLSQLLVKKYPELHVLTVKKKYISPRDDFMPFGGTVHRTGVYPHYPTFKDNLFIRAFLRLWKDYFCLLDFASGWIFPALIKGFKIIRRHKINLIIATGPPFSSMVIAFLLSRVTGVKLILDYRDPWSNHNRVFCKIFGKRINGFFERLSVGQAGTLVFCTRKMKENFIKDIGKHTKATCHVVHNGFLNRDEIQPLSLGKEKKNIIYAGVFYGQREISLLARPLLHLLNEGLISRDTFCFHVFGKLNVEDRETIKGYGLQEIIKEHAQVPYERIIKYLKGADILCLLSGSDVSYAVPFKFYDYLSVKKPILAVAPEISGVADMMNEIDSGRLALINSEDSILENLRTMLFENKKYSFSKAERYTWDQIGRKYQEAIEEVGMVN